MTDNLRERVLAAVRKGLADPVDIPKALKPRLRGYTIDSTKENAVTSPTIRNQTSSTEIKGITALPPVSANMDSQPRKPVEPSGATCKVEIVELPQAQRYRKTFGHLQLKPPEYVREDRWEQAVAGSSRLGVLRLKRSVGPARTSLGWPRCPIGRTPAIDGSAAMT
jgi:hypothetical protein